MTAVLSSKSAATIFNLGRGVLTLAFVVMLIAALHPDVRSSVRNKLTSDARTVVSIATGDLIGDGSKVTVVKVKTNDAMMIEVYQTAGDGTERLVERISMPDKKDGFFNFNGQATNLAIDDVDGDGRPEILVPSFDANLVGHLNIYSYDQSSQNFQRRLL